MIALFAALLLASAPNPVVDDASVLDIMDETSLASKLVTFESKHRVEIAVATFRKIPRGLTAQSHSRQLLSQWDVGSRTGDRGVLIAIYSEDREVYIQYTMATPHITDGQAKHVIDSYMLPRFKAGDLEGGILAGVSEVSATVLGQRIGAGASTPSRRFRLDESDMTFLIGMLIVGGFVIVQLANGSVHFGPSSYRRSRFNPFWGSSHRSSSWGGSSWGGGSRRSGGGGFRGRGAGGKW